MQVSSVSKSFSFLKVLEIPTMENGPRIAKKFYEELMGIQVWFFFVRGGGALFLEKIVYR